MSAASLVQNGSSSSCGDDVVDEPDAQRLLRVDEVAREAHLARAAHADRLDEQDGAAPARLQPDARVGVAEQRALRRDEEVAVERDLEAAGDRRPVDRPDQREAQRRDRPAAARGLGRRPPAAHDAAGRAELLEVEPGAERGVGAGEDDRVDARRRRRARAAPRSGRRSSPCRARCAPRGRLSVTTATPPSVVTSTMGAVNDARPRRRISLPGADNAGGAVGGDRHSPARDARVGWRHVPRSHPRRDRRQPADARRAAHRHPRDDGRERRPQPPHHRGARRLPRLLGLEPLGPARRAPDGGREQPDPAPGVRVHRLPPVLAAVPALPRGADGEARRRRPRRAVRHPAARAGQQAQPRPRVGARADAADRPRPGRRARPPARRRAPRRAQHRRPVRPPDDARRARPRPQLRVRAGVQGAAARPDAGSTASSPTTSRSTTPSA